MTFESILYECASDKPVPEQIAEPEFFHDLNLDQIVSEIVAGRDQYDLKPFYYAPPSRPETIEYRHEVMMDLQRKPVFDLFTFFSTEMSKMREQLSKASKIYYRLQKEAMFVDSVQFYCGAIAMLNEELARIELRSRGLSEFRDYIRNYFKSDRFERLSNETWKIKADLATVAYALRIRGDSVHVTHYYDESDFSVDVERTFEKFKQGVVDQHRFKFSDSIEMNHIEAGILEFVEKLNPKIFDQLEWYCKENVKFFDDVIQNFDIEIQFYVSYLEYVSDLKKSGLEFCYPILSTRHKDIDVQSAFDIALAKKLVATKSVIVKNDFYFHGNERIFVVSGPNQGGKTTFARTFGQTHYLGRLGCPIPGTKARLYFYDRIFVHFEREENIYTHRGKLEDDLVRIRRILDEATSDSIIILNEIFTSTALHDAIFLGKRILEKIMELDALCVCVTFIDELASLSERVVSVVSTVVPDDPALRTFRIVRRPADGRAYAISIAEKYRLTYGQLRERNAP